MIPLGLSLLCFLYYLAFLFRFGEMFYKGSDVVANTAYGMTMFSEVHRAGWTVPKLVHMVLFGSVYWITGDLWFVHLVLILGTALTVWAGCRLIQEVDESPVGCLAFGIFMMTLPRTFGTTLSGGPGCVNVMFLLLAIVFLDRTDRISHKIFAVLFLSLANLTRPDSWPCTYLLVLLVVAPRLFGRKEGPALNRTDLLFLIPLATPLLWVLVDWTVFGDPLYSAKIARTFAVEYLSGKKRLHGGGGGGEWSPVAAYFPKVKSALFELFLLSRWLSVKTGLVGLLGVAGTVAMLRKEPRTLLLVACPFAGTLLFYFVYALRGTLFRSDYVYTVLVCTLLIASIGLGSLCGLALRARPRLLGRFLQGGLACLVLLALTVGPFQKKIVAERIPQLKSRAALSVEADTAVEALVEDVRRSKVAPVILTSRWIAPSRIALRLGTGKDTFLIERLVSRERLGEPSLLPPLEGRTVYLCGPNKASRDEVRYLQRLAEQAKRRDMIYETPRIVIVKWTY
ncbi:MAG: hypothetical protein ACWGSD_00160 [Thermodesulfobacteriota bacterium]